MTLTAEQMADHLLNCKTCSEIREISSMKIQEHLKESEEGKSCSSCGINDHMSNCVKCRYLSLKVYNCVNIHLKYLRIINVIKSLFGLK